MLTWQVLSDYDYKLTIAIFHKGKLLTICTGQADNVTRILKTMGGESHV